MLKNRNKISLIVIGTVVVISLFAGCSGSGNTVTKSSDNTSNTTDVSSPMSNLNGTTKGPITQGIVKILRKT